MNKNIKAGFITIVVSAALLGLFYGIYSSYLIAMIFGGLLILGIVISIFMIIKSMVN